MNKKEILEILNKYNFDKNKIYIISGSAMVLYGIKEKTNDIDITIDEEYEKVLLENYNCTFEREIKDNGKTYKAYMIDDIINFSAHYYDRFNYNVLDGYNIQKVEDILKLKESLNREKDKKDIKALKEYINIKSINSLSLAYLGDAVYELYIRRYLLNHNKKVNDLQKEAINYVSAKAQSSILDNMLNENFLNEDEIEIIKRARNHKSHASKSTDIITYKKSTGLEALLGYLKMTNNDDRINEIMKYIVGD